MRQSLRLVHLTTLSLPLFAVACTAESARPVEPRALTNAEAAAADHGGRTPRLRDRISAAAVTSLTVAAGNVQQGTAGELLANRVVIGAVGSLGPVRGVALRVDVVTGGGRIERAELVTDSVGHASFGWWLGATPGAQQLRVTVANAKARTVDVYATAAVGRAAALELVSGGNQTAPLSAPLPQPVVLRLRDRVGNGVANAVLRVETQSTAGALQASTLTTDATGRAAFAWTLNANSGVQQLRVIYDTLPVLTVSATAAGTPTGTPTLERTVLVTGLANPWDLAFTPDSVMLFTERAGRLRVRLPDGTLRMLYQPSDLRAQDQGGLLGVAVDPLFVSNRFIYVVMSTVVGARTENRVRRLTVNGAYTAVSGPVDIVDSIPWGNGGAHNGGRLRFGADGYLYIGSGDNRSGPLPQRMDRLAGKVLRVDRNGDAAPNNSGAFGAGAHPAIYAAGFRNVQGLALRPGSGTMFSCEHGPGHSDEVTQLVNGGNGGWDPMTAPDTTYRGYDSGRSMTDLSKFPAAMRPTWTTGASSRGMSGCTFVSGDAWRDWNGALVVSLLSGTRAEVLRLSADGSAATNTPILAFGDRLRGVTQGFDGALYVLTDGKSGGDQIWRVVPR